MWDDGRQLGTKPASDAAAADLLLLDVGRAWVPSLFRSTPERAHDYEAKYVALANGRFDESAEGRRAARDRYLELYGIVPTPALLSARWAELEGYSCAREPVPAVLRNFPGVEWDEDGAEPATPLDDALVDALRYRLRCAGHLRGGLDGEIDLGYRRALEEFERHHRIYARGSLQGETLAALKTPLLELERLAIVRALTERLMLDLGIIEDGSASEVAGGTPLDLEATLRAHVERALGIATADGARRFHRRFSEATQRDHYIVALPAIELPDYYSADMGLSVEIDRGDIYFEFPYDEEGNPLHLPVEHRPSLTLYAEIAGRRKALVRYGTTIGGWRIQRRLGRDYFEYKESPVGRRAWTRIESAPVWLPTSGTPPEALVLETLHTAAGALTRELNENLVGPGYASAFGLVAAYHRKMEHVSGPEGGDEGIRTHGSSDYTSIWRRASLGCHRLHNHRALRLFTFILAHRPHRRAGHRPVNFHRTVRVGDFSAAFEVRRSGYGFELRRPLPVDVLPGRVRGRLQRPSSGRIPADPFLTHNGGKAR